MLYNINYWGYTITFEFSNRGESVAYYNGDYAQWMKERWRRDYGLDFIGKKRRFLPEDGGFLKRRRGRRGACRWNVERPRGAK